MVLDWRDADCKPGPCRVVDLDTGEQVRFVFFVDTEARRVGRYLKDDFGGFVLDQSGDVPQIASVWESRRVAVYRALDGADESILIGH